MKDNLFISLIIAAAGTGSRMQNKTEKPFIPINGIPLVIHTILAAQKINAIDQTVLIVNPNKKNDWENLLKEYKISDIEIVAGGERRQDSVENGFNCVSQKTDIILIHDGARPFITKRLINDGIDSASKYGVSIPVVPVKSTIKKIDENGMVKETVNRNELAAVQTPQCFKYDILEKCLKNNQTDVTDEATLAEKIGFDVKTFAGDNENIKITTPEDIIFAEQILKIRK